ncbi:hypothetical protein VMCG_06310 [Cytospora schulzeri]|uniref:Uncharacterized protein n=1 Tax=Cytospora schulzeri TaxID=448051 RepID=A0A423W857_9PEZI|nr:hypothetical protein VMCG_06310 [Valsa malicola]
MGTHSLRMKRGLMDRLRHVRSSALPASAKTYEGDHHNNEKPPIHAPAKAEVETSHRGRSGDRAAKRTKSKGRPVHREGSLDMEELDTKLEHYARISKHPKWNDTRDQARADSMEDESDPEHLEQAASTQSTGQAAAAAAHGIGSRLHPSDQTEEEQPGPSSDYETFIREAEEDDRRRGPPEGGKGHGSSNGRGRVEQPLNSFYSNNWMARSEPPEKLSEIQESGDEEDDDDNAGGDRVSASASASGSSDNNTSVRGGGVGLGVVGGGTTASKDVAASAAAPRMPPLPRAHTDPCGVQGSSSSRHIQFSAGTGEAGGERMGGRRGSGASCTQHRMKSPPRPVRRQRSMIKVIADYIRPTRD